MYDLMVVGPLDSVNCVLIDHFPIQISGHFKAERWPEGFELLPLLRRRRGLPAESNHEPGPN